MKRDGTETEEATMPRDPGPGEATGAEAVAKRAASGETRRRRVTARQLAPCGLTKRQTCEAELARFLEGCRVDKVALRRVGRQNCAIFECVDERGLAGCGQCREHPCVFHEKAERICPGQSGRTEDGEGRAWRLTAPGFGALAKPIAEATTTAVTRVQVPERTISRARWYLAALQRFLQAGVKVTSSAEIGAKVGVSSALVRRDLCYFGQFGTPSLGYQVEELLQSLLSLFEDRRPRRVAWVGAERLRMGAGSGEQLTRHNWQVAGVFDADPRLVGTTVGELEVMALSRLGEVAGGLGINTAVLAVPESEAQAAVDRLVDAGVEAILNLTPVPITVPGHVAVQQADLATQLMLLSYQSGLGGEVMDN